MEKIEKLTQVQNETMQKMNEIKEVESQPKKKKRGRPPKSKTTTTTPTTSEIPTERVGLKLTFKTIFDFIGKTLAVAFAFKSFEVTSEESEMLASQGDDVIQDFFPHVESKWAKLGIFLTSLITVFGKRFYEYEKDKQKKNKANTKNTPENEAIVKIKDGF